MKEHQCECTTEEFVSKIRDGMLEEETIYDLADFFKIFSDSSRIRILWALHESEMCVQGLSQSIGMSLSAVSHQLKTLKNADLVKSRREGKNIYYSLCDEHIETLLSTALEHLQEEEK